jgi:Subtilase family
MKTHRAIVVRLVFLEVALVSMQCLGQSPSGQYHTGQNSGVDVRTHMFRPAISPDLSAAAAPVGTTKGTAAMSAAAAGQMNALLQDKQARTAAQRKISSKLIYTTRMLQGLPAAPGVSSLETGVEVDGEGNVLVDITADVTDAFLTQLKNQGAYIYSSYPLYRSVRALVPAARLETIASWPNVIFIKPKQEAMTSGFTSTTELGANSSRAGLVGKRTGRTGVSAPQTAVSAPDGVGLPRAGFTLRAARVRSYLESVLAQGTIQVGVVGSPAPTGQGSKTSEGDLTHQAFDARMAFGINGAGIKIGVLSDGATNLAASQALGDLPSDVTVLPGQIGSGDEGTAMMEIIHDLAPGAKLYFATAFSGVASFAQNIHDLRAAGCDIIIDDVFYYDENPFVDGQTSAVVSPTNGGLILQAVNDVTAAGALYFSSAGNEGNVDEGSAGSYESDFVDGGSLGLLAGGTVHLFGANPYDTISASGGNYVMLFWSDPLGASSNDYDLFVLNASGTAVLEASTDVQNGTQDPMEWLSPIYNAANNRLVVLKQTGAQDRYFHLNTFRGRLAEATAGETHGHSHAALAYSVAATPAQSAWSSATLNGPYPDPFGASNEIEWFSSDGPRHLFYQADGTAFTPGDVSSTGGILRQKPDITAADGVSVTGVGGFGSPFYGTSAAAPHAGAIAALIKSASPNISNSEIRTALTGTAVDIMGAGVDRDSGAGIVMALEAVNSLGVSGSANPEFGNIVATDNPGNGNGMLEAGEGGMVTIELKNTGGVVDATGISAALTTSTPGVTITMPNTSAYADLPQLTGRGNNLTPFTFTLASDYPCGQTIDFTLTVTYTGGPNPRGLQFTVPTGPMFNITKNLDGTAPVSPMAEVTTTTGTQTGRSFRTGVTTTCGTTPKAWPGYGSATGTRQHDTYTFTATQNTCTTVTMTAANGINLFIDAYSPSFDASNISTNYYADSGASGSVQSFGMAITAGQTYTLTVHDVPAGAASGTSYNLQFSGCTFASATPNHAPVALAQDVTVVADSTYTASASVDNGSYDPDAGDSITVSQTPAGPYPIGDTPVTLTVVDSQGATAQANATVTATDAPISVAVAAGMWTAGAAQTQTVATITHSIGVAGDLATTISWGDGTANSAGTVSGTAPDFTVRGTHTFASGGAKTITVSVQDGHGGTASQTGSVTVTDFDFGGQALPAKTVNAGASATQTITIRPNPAPWNSAVTLACSGLPLETTCAFHPASVTPGNANATSALVVATAGPNAAMMWRPSPPVLAAWLGFGSLGMLALVIGAPRRKRAARALLGLLVFGVVTLTLVNCGGSSARGGTPAGTYTVTVTATSGGVSHAATFQLTVN